MSYSDVGNNVPKAAETRKAATMTVGEPELKTQIEEQGNKVRQLKEAKAAKNEVDAAVKSLLDLKATYKTLTGQDYVPAGGNQPPRGGGGGGKKEPKKESKPKEAPAPKESADGSGKKQTKLGIDCKKSENLSDWFSQVRNTFLYNSLLN